MRRELKNEWEALDPIEDDGEGELIHRARRDILSFRMATRKGYEINWHHAKLADKLNAWVFGEILFLMVFMPPRHGKSELVSRALPPFNHGINPDDEVMAVSYLDSLAGDMTRDVQAIHDSPEYKRIFPEIRIPRALTHYSKGVRNNASHAIMGHKGIYRSAGVGGSFTGKGANKIIIDDPIKGREIADSPAFRDKLWKFWKDDLFSRLETNLLTKRPGQVLITLTRWHEDDLAGRLLNEMTLPWDVLEYPAIKVDAEATDDPREIGEALWPGKYDLDRLAQIKATSGPRGWSSLYQQNPVPDGGTIFGPEMFEFADLPGGYDYMFATCDTSYKEKQENDFTVFSVWGVRDEQLYLVDVFKKRMKSTESEKWVLPFLKPYVHYGYRNTWIEPKGHGIYLNQLLAKKGIGIPSDDELKEFYHDRRFEKSERANNVAPHLAHRKVYISNQIKEKEDLVAEAIGFPKMKHDDWVDTLVDALKLVYAREVTTLDFV